MIRHTIVPLLMFLILIGCRSAQPSGSVTEETQVPTFQAAQVDIDKILQAEHLIPIRQENMLAVVDPQFSQPLEVYTFKSDEIPITSNIFDIKISPDNKWVVWYTPVKGIIGLDITKQQTTIIHPPSQWLSTNPYFEFSETENTLYFVTDEGTVLNRYKIDEQQNQRINIPYPFGNVFHISPNNQHVIFVSGYRQTDKLPEYMFTDINGNSPQIFSTDTDIANRFLIAWAPDSSGMIQVSYGDLVYHPYTNPDITQQLVHVTDDHILRLNRINDQLFVLDDQGYWHVYSYTQSKELARTPVSIAEELRNPVFYPWTEDKFLISELVGDQDLQYNRLWTSNFRGSKKLVVSQFGETIIQTESLTLD